MMGLDILRRQLGKNGQAAPAALPSETPPPTPWLAEKIKELLGVDFEELKNFGDQIGSMLTAFGAAMQRIEAKTDAIVQRLDAIEQKLPPAGFVRNGRSITKAESSGPERF